MKKYKIVFRDQERDKILFGDIDLSDPALVKVTTDLGNTVFVNKTAIVFIKEIVEGMP